MCCEKFSQKRLNYCNCIGGDDHLMIFKSHLISDNDMSDFMSKAEQLGLTFKFLKNKSFQNARSDDRTVFYKYTVDRGDPIIPASSLLERVFIPWNKNYSDNSRCFEFLLEVMPSLEAPRSTHLMYYALYQSVYKRTFDRDILISRIFRIHKTAYERVMRMREYVSYKYQAKSIGMLSCKFTRE
jgi:hypothetical protein